MISVRRGAPIFARLQSAICLGYMLGGLDALTVARGSEFIAQFRIIVVGASVGAICGALIGLGGTLVWRFLRAIRRLYGTPLARYPVLTGERVACFVLAGVGALIAFAIVLKASERVMLESLRVTVIILGCAVSVAVALLGAHWAESVLGNWIRDANQRNGPYIVSRSLSFAVTAVLPTLATSAPLLIIYGPELGSLRLLILVADFIVLWRWMFLFMRSRRHRAPWRFVWGLPLWILIVAGQLLLRPGTTESQRLTQAWVLPDVLDLLQRMTDVDHDGYSGMFGGRDCAPFDRSRHPGAHDIPDNGIDENCDGRDATSGDFRLDIEPKFSSHISRNQQPFNVVWYIVDSLRADHLMIYGYQYDTSPTLTKLAAESWVFSNAYSQSSTTSLSIPSMLSGEDPLMMHWKRGGYPVASSKEFYLSQAFSAHGYLTALVINNWVKVNLPGLQHGFEQILVSPGEVNWRSGDYLLSNLIQVSSQARASGKPFFAVAHVDDVHHPYTASDGKAVPVFPSRGDAGRYDRGIALFDQGLRAFVNHLNNLGLWDRTVLIVTADHGEEFHEHGGTIHSRTCYEEVAHVPLLVRIPNEGSRRIEQRVALLDLAPTLLEILGDHSPESHLDGQSLYIPVSEPSSVNAERPITCTIFQLMSGRQAFFTRAVRCSHWSLFEEASSGRVELYDQSNDPGEHTDLSDNATFTPVVSQLRRLLPPVTDGNLFRVSRGLD